MSIVFICLCFNMVSFTSQKRLGPRPDQSPLGVLFKISDKHPHPFHMQSPPPPRGVYLSGPSPLHLPWFAQGNGNDYKPAHPVTKSSLSFCAAFLFYTLKFSNVKEAQKTLDMIENCKTKPIESLLQQEYIFRLLPQRSIPLDAWGLL